MVTKLPYNEQELLAELAGGSQHAYDRVFKQLYRPLCFFAYKFLYDHSKAEDVVQESMLKLWQRRSDFESMRKIQSFLYVSVRNACYDEIEHQKVINKHEDSLSRNTELQQQNALDIMMQAEVVSRVFEMVDTLPEQCRKIIRMTFEDGKSPKEIADELGIAVSTVSNQKTRGLILLKKRLSGSDVALAISIFLPEIHKIM